MPEKSVFDKFVLDVNDVFAKLCFDNGTSSDLKINLYVTDKNDGLRSNSSDFNQSERRRPSRFWLPLRNGKSTALAFLKHASLLSVAWQSEVPHCCLFEFDRIDHFYFGDYIKKIHPIDTFQYALQNISQKICCKLVVCITAFENTSSEGDPFFGKIS